MKQKIINSIVGVVAITLIIGALVILQNKKSDVSVTDTAIESAINSTTTDVLGSTTDTSVITASIVGEEKLPSGLTEIAISVELKNTGNDTLQFSPPIDIAILDSVSGKLYALESTPKTTLFGGPLEAGLVQQGIIYTVISPNDQIKLELLYQPNNESTTKSVAL